MNNSYTRYFDKIIETSDEVKDTIIEEQPLQLSRNLINKFGLLNADILQIIIFGALYNEQMKNIRMYKDDKYWVSRTIQTISDLTVSGLTKGSIYVRMNKFIEDGYIEVYEQNRKKFWYRPSDKLLKIIEPDMWWIMENIKG